MQHDHGIPSLKKTAKNYIPRNFWDGISYTTLKTAWKSLIPFSGLQNKIIFEVKACKYVQNWQCLTFFLQKNEARHISINCLFMFILNNHGPGFALAGQPLGDAYKNIKQCCTYIGKQQKQTKKLQINKMRRKCNYSLLHLK